MNKLQKEKTVNTLFILPALSLFLVFSFYPLLRTFHLSFFEWDGVALQMKFVGIAHYLHIFTQNPVFWKSVMNAAYVTILALTVQNGLALLLALLVKVNKTPQSLQPFDCLSLSKSCLALDKNGVAQYTQNYFHEL